MTLLEKLAEAASTHCPPDVLKCCVFCRRDRYEAKRFARIAIESMPCLFGSGDVSCRSEKTPQVLWCKRCRALAELSAGDGS